MYKRNQNNNSEVREGHIAETRDDQHILVYIRFATESRVDDATVYSVDDNNDDAAHFIRIVLLLLIGVMRRLWTKHKK